MYKFFVVLFSLIVFSCSNVKPGYVMLAVNLYGSKKGDVNVLGPGRYIRSFATDYYKFPVFNQNYTYENKQNFSFSSQGLVIKIDLGLQYKLNEDYIIDIFKTYRKGVNEITSVVIRNVIRDYLNQYSTKFSIDDLMDGKIIDLIKLTEESTKNYFKDKGIEIISLSMTSAPYYPQSIIDSIEEKNAATQKAIQRENELREAKAAYEIARVNAQTNIVVSQTITPMLLKKMAIEKWDGKLPLVVGENSAVPFIDVK